MKKIKKGEWAIKKALFFFPARCALVIPFRGTATSRGASRVGKFYKRGSQRGEDGSLQRLSRFFGNDKGASGNFPFSIYEQIKRSELIAEMQRT